MYISPLVQSVPIRLRIIFYISFLISSIQPWLFSDQKVSSSQLRLEIHKELSLHPYLTLMLIGAMVFPDSFASGFKYNNLHQKPGSLLQFLPSGTPTKVLFCFVNHNPDIHALLQVDLICLFALLSVRLWLQLTTLEV